MSEPAANGVVRTPLGPLAGSSGGGPEGRPALAIACGSVAEVAPGERSQLPLAVRNDSDVSVRAKVDLIGAAPGWATLPPLLGPLQPGETRRATILLSLPAGYPACTLRLGLRVTAIDPATATSIGLPASADLDLWVAETGTVDLSVPDQVFGSSRARFEATLYNRGHEQQVVHLSGSSSEGVVVRFSPGEARLEAGSELAVRAKLRHRRPLVGSRRRMPFAVEAKGSGPPAIAASTFVQSPYVPTWVMRALAVLVTVAAFAAVATVLVLKLRSAYTPKTETPSIKLAPPHFQQPARARSTYPHPGDRRRP